MNRAADALKAGSDGIRITTSGIRLALREENEHLQGLIDRVMTSQQSQRAIGEAMRASRPSGRPAYGVWVNAIAQPPEPLTAFRPAVWVLISDPALTTIPPASHLLSLFGLTEAEARLAARPASGEALKDAADALGVTYGTARSCLTQIFQKTETRSQGQLIQLLLSCWPGLKPT